jgi:hypothetical protein
MGLAKVQLRPHDLIAVKLCSAVEGARNRLDRAKGIGMDGLSRFDSTEHYAARAELVRALDQLNQFLWHEVVPEDLTPCEESSDAGRSKAAGTA